MQWRHFAPSLLGQGGGLSSLRTLSHKGKQFLSMKNLIQGNLDIDSILENIESDKNNDPKETLKTSKQQLK